MISVNLLLTKVITYQFQGSEYGVSDKKYKELKADGFLMERSYIKRQSKRG